MKNLTLEHIAQACQGIYRGSEADKTREVTGIFTDSRKMQEGSLSYRSKAQGQTDMIL